MMARQSCALLSIAFVASNAFIPMTVHHPSCHSSRDDRMLHVAFAERKPFITGNWKMNPSSKQEAIALATDIAASIETTTDDDGCSRDVALFVPFPYLESVQNAVGDKLIVGAQLVTPQDQGAFTGGVSPRMLKSMGIQWALTGHSERRTLNGETNQDINEQTLKLIENGMNVVLCVGETLDEYEKGLVASVCQIQLKEALAGVSAEQMNQVTVAYEPVWAIGTGKVATPEIAQSVHAICRQILTDLYNRDIADATRILYGGSVGPDTVDGLLDEEDIDGALVGGASLSSEKFARIINFEPVKMGKRKRLRNLVQKVVSKLANS